MASYLASFESTKEGFVLLVYLVLRIARRINSLKADDLALSE